MSFVFNFPQKIGPKTPVGSVCVYFGRVSFESLYFLLLTPV